jgi:hypothetical protein
MYTQITMLNNRGQPYVPWKGNSTNNAVPSWSRPPQKTEKVPNGPDFKARPIKHWRKQLDPTPYSGSGASAIGMPFNRPGSEVFLGRDSSSNCETCSDSNATITKSSNEAEQYNTIYTYTSDKFFDVDTNKPVCVACNPEANIIKPSNTLVSKKYYSDRASYLKSRCKQYVQNLSGKPIENIQYLNGNNPVWPSDSPNGSQVFSTNDCCKVSGVPSTLIYKPNNNQYAKQGAVDSSDRITRLKLNTINKNGESFTIPWGASAASAGGYRGDTDAPYFIKSKNQQTCVPFHRDGNKTVCDA